MGPILQSVLSQFAYNEEADVLSLRKKAAHYGSFDTSEKVAHSLGIVTAKEIELWNQAKQIQYIDLIALFGRVLHKVLPLKWKRIKMVKGKDEWLTTQTIPFLGWLHQGELRWVNQLNLPYGAMVKVLYRGDDIFALYWMRGAITDADDQFMSGYHWNEQYPLNILEKKIKRYAKKIGRLYNVQISSRSDTGRVTALKVTGSRKTVVLRGLRIRWSLGVKENVFDLIPVYDANNHLKSLTVYGKAWGHGVGMCQTGAYGMALKGKNYIDILTKYYSGVTVG